MIDPVQMYLPGSPGSVTYVERSAYRATWYPKGWLSLDDAYAGGEPWVLPGTIIDSAEITADASPAGTAFAEITAQARVDVPLLAQPVVLEANLSLASITSVSTWTLGWCRTASLNALSAKSCTRVADIPLSAAEGEGFPFTIRYVIPAQTPAATWTIVSLRDAGTGTLKIEANAIFGCPVTATAG